MWHVFVYVTLCIETDSSWLSINASELIVRDETFSCVATIIMIIMNIAFFDVRYKSSKYVRTSVSLSVWLLLVPWVHPSLNQLIGIAVRREPFCIFLHKFRAASLARYSYYTHGGKSILFCLVK